MRIRLSFLYVVAVAVSTVGHAQTTAVSGSRPAHPIIRNATVVDGNGTPAKGPYDIVVDGGLITQVVALDPVTLGLAGANRRPRGEAGTAEIDATGKYVLPGLINADAYRNPPHPDPLRIRSVEDAFLGGPPDTMPQRYADASPITYATRRLPPTLLIYASRDHIVEPRYGEQMARALAATGTPSAFLEIPWADHAFDAVFNGPSSQLASYYTERFIAWAVSH